MNVVVLFAPVTQETINDVGLQYTRLTCSGSMPLTVRAKGYTFCTSKEASVGFQPSKN